MNISIAARLKPFSHLPGTRCLIPGTQKIVEAYPALVRIYDFSGKILKEIPFDIEGPLKNFTVMQDLERGCVTIFSEVTRFHIFPGGEVVFKKNPPLLPIVNRERLSLGSHKKQEWEAIKKRGDFCEIFAFWYRLGSLLILPKQEHEESSGMFFFLKQIREAIAEHRPEKIVPLFNKLFLAGFSDMLIPRASDVDHQGILPSSVLSSTLSPLYLLTEGARLIRSLFFVQNMNELFFLPNLPPECFAGRMTHVSCLPFGTLDFEWSQKQIKKIHLHALQDAEIGLHFPKDIRSFRLRSQKEEKGLRVSCGERLEIKSGSLYLLDQFQK